MDDIIRSIIDIDRGASKKLEDAEKEKIRIISAAKAREEELIKQAVENSRRELEELEERERAEAESRIAELDEKMNGRIAQMKNSFEINSEKWCDEIFHAVTGV